MKSDYFDRLADVVDNLLKGTVLAIVMLIVFALFFMLYGCQSVNYLTAYDIEAEALILPQCDGVFDCQEKAKYAEAKLIQKGFKVEEIIQKEGEKSHACVYWEKDKEKGTILCNSAWETIARYEVGK